MRQCIGIGFERGRRDGFANVAIECRYGGTVKIAIEGRNWFDRLRFGAPPPPFAANNALSP
jgi:hypothetical protein